MSASRSAPLRHRAVIASFGGGGDEERAARQDDTQTENKGSKGRLCGTTLDIYGVNQKSIQRLVGKKSYHRP